ncbi:unnamed protein product [Linum trigynum]|uniref:DC1 domain-containing protein n=1 Tax=Linum trigynum TaxID=586398 RepID=A0AAV2FJY8_9ROSI
MTEKDDLGLTIIAMKGDSLSRNRQVAFNLARFLKCPLIDIHDIHQAIQKPSSSQTNNNNTEESPALDAAYGFASTQLSLKFPVIINGPHPLPPGATIGNLWGPLLAASSGARLVAVECHHRDDAVAAKGDDGISSVHVDAETFDSREAEGVVSKIRLLLRQQKHNTTTTPSNNSKVVAKGKQRRKNDHLHEWVEKQPMNSNTAEGWACIACQDGNDAVQIGTVTSYYQCTDCDFALHKHCAEKPDKTLNVLVLLNRCPPYLKGHHRPKGYEFPSKVKCRNCRDDDDDVEEEEEFSAVDDCHDCLMQTNLHHKFLPTVLRYKDHRLNLVIMPFGYDYKYLCGDCGAIGYSVGYKCYECNEWPNYHVDCALVPAYKTIVLRR